jgi:tetratricopeptide (TPR) repeat protein
MPWDLPEDPPTVRQLLAAYGERIPGARKEVARSLFLLANGQGYAALSRLIVEDPDLSVEWGIAQMFRDASARLSNEQTRQLILRADTPAAMCLAGWCLEKQNFPHAVEMYELAVRSAAERNEPCLDALSPVFDTLIGLKRFKKDYEGAADLLRIGWTMTLRESDPAHLNYRTLDQLFALHATHGPLPGFPDDVRNNPAALSRPQVIYSLGRMCEEHRHTWIARFVYELAFLRGFASPETREASGEFLLEQNWSNLAESELRAIIRSWVVYAATLDSARMRLGMLHANLGHDELAARYLAQALPGLHDRSVWLAIQRGEKHYYGRGAENYLWTVQHFHALRFAVSRHDTPEAEKQALALATLAPEEPAVALAAMPILKSTAHPEEAKQLFEKVYHGLRRDLDESPDDSRRLNNLAWICAVSHEHLDDALAAAKRATELDPNDANILDTLAEVHYQRGERAEALQCAQRAAEINPENAYFKNRVKRFEESAKD